MGSDFADQRELEVLRETVRILESENEQLAERAEDTLLLSLIAESITVAEGPLHVLEIGLERISLLKDVPICTCCELRDGEAVVIAAYRSHCRNDLRGTVISLPRTVPRVADIEAVYLSCDEDELGDLRASDAERDAVRSALLIRVDRQTGARYLFIFADDRADSRLAGLNIMLHRVVDMMVTEMDKLDLLASLRDLNEQLETSNEALVAATQAKSDFLANMSHEIRTPMNAILGFSQLLRRDPMLSDQQRDRLDIINRNGEHLLALINDVLEMSKIESGRIVMRSEPFDLALMLSDLEAIFAEQALAKNIRLVVETLGTLPDMVVTDKGKLRQVLVNLLGNAIKFTSEGRVVLRAECRRGEDDELTLAFEIEDTGPGIAREEMGLLFAQFEQSASGRESGTGTGLGLAISREYVRRLGGEITVTSEPGVGSVFAFSVPAQEGASGHAPGPINAAPVAALAPEQPVYRVLVADDHNEMRQLVSQMLGQLGFDVHAVRDGGQAVAAFTEWHPHIVLMDMRMPVMNGPEAIKAIRALPGGDEVKIVSLTASVFEETKRELLALGADDFIGKPFSEDELFETIGRLLNARYVREERPATGPAPRGRSAEQPAPAPASPRETLGDELSDSIADAARHADFDLVAQLSAGVAERDPQLAEQLAGLAQGFAAKRILELLDEPVHAR